jgi:HD-GYP domain-containing protein (c-di-GMP phosphodiesterase class II)
MVGMAWLSLDPALLRIGLYIKIDHSWMEHPFVRNTFTVSSPTEIAIIRKHRLTKLQYDPEKSHADVIANLMDPDHFVPAVEPDVETAQDIESDEQSMRKEKAVHLKQVLDHRKAVEKASKEYAKAANDCSVMMVMANAGQVESLELASKMMDAIAELLKDESIALSLVCTPQSSDAGQELAMQAVSVSTLVSMTAKTLALSEQEAQHVGMGALFHNIGKNRIPLSIRLKTDYLLPAEQKLVQMYPQLGKEILEALPGVPSEVIEIVYQHREALDGSGYPKRLFNGDISKLARLVGTVTEFNALTGERRPSHAMGPSQALAHLYSNMHQKYGRDVIDPFIATLTVFPPGSFVELNEGSYGLVMKSNSMERMRPLIMLYERGASHSQAAMVDLTRERSLSIKKSLDPKLVPAKVKEVLSLGKLNEYTMTSM